MTVAQALRDAAKRLEDVSDTARLDAELLMAEALGVTRSRLLLQHMGDEVLPAFADLLARRLRHEPVAYILGRQEFFGRSFAVSPAVLIPRGDSECVVEAALEACPAPARILDCGVGSGALLLTLLAECPAAEGVGVDRSEAALAIAQANAESLGFASRATMLRRDWTEGGWQTGLGRFDLIIANPPYVEEEAQLAPSVRFFEPAEALFAGNLGIDAYLSLVPQIPALLEEGGSVALEIGAMQAADVQHIACEAGFSCTLCRDLGGRPRALIMRLGLGNEA